MNKEGEWNNSDNQIKEFVALQTPSFENFVTLYHLFSELAATKLEGKKFVNAATLEAFMKRWYRLSNDDTFCHGGTIRLMENFLVCRIEKWTSLSVLHNIEYYAVSTQQNIACANMRRANFVFLCCIHKLFYKDIRRLLYEFVEMANDDELDNRIAELNKFRLKYCR